MVVKGQIIVQYSRIIEILRPGRLSVRTKGSQPLKCSSTLQRGATFKRGGPHQGRRALFLLRAKRARQKSLGTTTKVVVWSFFDNMFFTVLPRIPQVLLSRNFQSFRILRLRFHLSMKVFGYSVIFSKPQLSDYRR